MLHPVPYAYQANTSRALAHLADRPAFRLIFNVHPRPSSLIPLPSPTLNALSSALPAGVSCLAAAPYDRFRIACTSSILCRTYPETSSASSPSHTPENHHSPDPGTACDASRPPAASAAHSASHSTPPISTRALPCCASRSRSGDGRRLPRPDRPSAGRRGCFGRYIDCPVSPTSGVRTWRATRIRRSCSMKGRLLLLIRLSGAGHSGEKR